jgi:outer membrane protein assembly factor BamD
MPIKNRFFDIVKKCLLSIILLLFVFACSLNKTAKDTNVFEPEASFKEANDLITKGYYDEAREILETIKAKDATQKYATLAKVRIADTYFEDGLYEEAAVEYESFLDMHSYHKYAPYAQYKLALCYFKRIKTIDVSYSWAHRAWEEFKKLQRNYPRNPYMGVTESRINMCKRILGEYEFYVGNFYFKKGSYKAAANRFEGMLQNYPDSKKESEALYYLGLSYENLGKRDKAVTILTSLIEKFPSIKLTNEAKEIIASFDGKK